VPTETAVPTETPTNTPEPPAGATVCVNAFADDNGNGQFDANEGYMGSVAFRVASGSQVIGQAVSTGSNEAVCFEGLEPGAYQIEQVVPGPLEMTTAANTSVTVAEGQTAGVQFGSRLRVEGDASEPDSVADAGSATVEPTVAGDEAPETVEIPEEESGLASYSGLILLVVAVILLGGLLFVVLRRTA
jgi:cobalamin biosynthesis Mg chelatase CobN